MNSKLIKQLQELDVPDEVYSYSLFKSDHLNYLKHISPFCDYLRRCADPEKHIVFATKENSIRDFVPSGVHVIDVPQHSDYNNHLYRYYAAATKAKTIVCLGTDKPVPHPDLRRCMNIADEFHFAMVVALMEGHPRNLVGGRCVINHKAKANFLNALQNWPETSSWNCDQNFLTAFVKDRAPSLVINAPVSVYKAETQDWLLRRLAHHPTIIVREPNKYDNDL